MEALGDFEMFITARKATRHRDPEDHSQNWFYQHLEVTRWQRAVMNSWQIRTQGSSCRYKPLSCVTTERILLKYVLLSSYVQPCLPTGLFPQKFGLQVPQNVCIGCTHSKRQVWVMLATLPDGCVVLALESRAQWWATPTPCRGQTGNPQHNADVPQVTGYTLYLSLLVLTPITPPPSGVWRCALHYPRS
jgi:hypothetical protein